MGGPSSFRRSFLTGAVVLLGCGTVLKPPAPPSRLDVKMEGALFESGNGYRFATLPDAGAKVIRVDFRYPVGSADDPPGKEGLAHLVEHLLFEVEVARPSGKTSIGAELGRVALATNAFTFPDSTVYVSLAAPSALDEIVRLEVDRLAVGCAGLTPEIFAREREVVLNELRQTQGASGAAIQRVIAEAIYPSGHAYRRVDSVDTVAKLELTDVCEFLATAYHRGKAMLIVSGAVDGPSLQAAAGKYFGRLKNRDVSAKPTPPAIRFDPGTAKLRADIDEPVLIATWALPPRASRDFRLLSMAFRYIASRLEGFAFTYGWGRSGDWWIMGGAHAPVLAVEITLRSPGDAGEAIASAKKAAEHARRMMYRDGDDRESQRWRAQWQAQAESLLASWESLGSRNHLFGDFLQYDTDEGFLIGRIDELTKATPHEAGEAVDQWLSPGRARFLLVEPSGSPAVARVRSFTGGAEAHAVRVDPALADQPLPAPEARLAANTIRYQVGNGISVVLWPHGKAPLVHGRLVIDSGTAHDPRASEGVSMLVGAGDVEADSLVFYDRQLATRVDELVRSLAFELRGQAYEITDEDKAYLRGLLRSRRAKERQAYQRDLGVALYGEDHPYARPSLNEDSLDHIHHDKVIGWARDHIVPKNAVLVIAGQFDPDLVKRHIAYNADTVSSGKDSNDQHPDPKPRRRFIAGYEEKPSPTVAIDVRFVGGRGMDRDHAKRLVLEQVLSSVLSDLRGKQALTYGFQAAYSPRRAGGLWQLHGEVDAARAAEGAAALVALLGQVRSDPESYRSAFVLARQKVLESLLMTATDSGAIADRLTLLARFDLPDDYFDRVAEQVAETTLKDFHTFVARELDETGQVFGAFGNTDAVDAAIAAVKADWED
jgi:zinc protease